MRLQKKCNFRSFDVNNDGTIDRYKAELFNQYLTNMDSDLTRLFDITNSGISLGLTSNLSPGENVFGQWLTVADTGNANTQFTVPHTLSSQGIGLIPGNFLITMISAGGIVYKDPVGTAWTTSNIYLKCTTANTALNIFITR